MYHPHQLSLSLHTNPPIIPDGAEQIERLPHPVLRTILSKHHVVTAAVGNEDDGCDIIETLDPLASLISLASYIKHAVCVRV